MTRPEHELSLLQLLTDTQSALARVFNHRAQHFGLTRPQWRVLSGLYGHGGITQTELAELVSIARSPLGKIVDQLESAGYIVRTADPDDRRINRLHLTEAFTPLVEPTQTLVKELEEAVLDGIAGDSFVEQLRAVRRRALAMADEELSAA